VVAVAHTAAGATTWYAGRMRRETVVVMALAPLVARPASATVRPEVSLRSGYGVPLGGTDTEDLSDLVGGQVPLWLDAGVRVADRFFIGLYAQHSISFLGEGQASACRSHDRYVAQASGATSCRLEGHRFGVEFLYHVRKSERFDAWLGVGTGYEWLALKEETTGVVSTGSMFGPRNQTLTVVTHGFEFANIQVGMDALLVGGLAVGPFATLTFAKYSSADGSCDGDCGGTTVVSHTADGDFHQWVYGGLRVTYVF